MFRSDIRRRMMRDLGLWKGRTSSEDISEEPIARDYTIEAAFGNQKIQQPPMTKGPEIHTAMVVETTLERELNQLRNQIALKTKISISTELRHRLNEAEQIYSPCHNTSLSKGQH